MTLAEAAAVLALLAALEGPRGAPAARALAELLDRRQLVRASVVLIERAASASAPSI